MAIPQKAVLLTTIKTKWPFLAILWPNCVNYGFLTILAENNLTSLYQVKEGANCQKLSIIALTQDRMTIFGHDDDDDG